MEIQAKKNAAHTVMYVPPITGSDTLAWNEPIQTNCVVLQTIIRGDDIGRSSKRLALPSLRNFGTGL